MTDRTHDIVTKKIAEKVERPVFIVRLTPAPGVDPIHAMRLLLKAAKRYGLRCTEVIEEATERKDQAVEPRDPPQ